LASKHETPDFKDGLKSLQGANLYRRLITVDNIGPVARVNGKKTILLCSNDYLGLSQNKQVIKAISSAVKNGVSQCSSRLVAGNTSTLEELEEGLAKQKHCEKVLAYPTGYMANLGVISSFAREEDLVVSDELNHASIVDACKLSRATVRVFKHNDVEDLLTKLSSSEYRKKLVVTEGIFSMDGDCAKLKEMGKIARENNALFIVDDAHGDFVCGANFRGTAEYMDAEKYVGVLVSSLSKGLGCFGGYVAGTSDMIEYLINKSRQFIYTSALPSIFASAALVALKIAVKGSQQKKLWDNVEKFRKGLLATGLKVNSPSHIMPIIIGDERKAVDFSKMLLEKGVFAQAIRYPTVPKGSARIRVSMTSLLDDYIDDALDVFRKTAEELSLL